MTNLPLEALHKKHGASMASGSGWDLPDHYGDPISEHEAVRQGAGLIDQSGRGRLHLTGKDCGEFLQGMVTNDVQALIPGAGCYAAITSSKAKTLADSRIYRLEDGFLLDLEPEVTEKIHQHLDKYIIASDVTITSLTQRWGMLSVYGPKSPEILAGILGTSNLPSRDCQFINSTFDSNELLVARNEMAGEIGFDLLLPAQGLEALFEKFIQAGVKPVGQQALNTLRVEAGIPRYGVDMDESHFPMEAGLTERAISETKGCYIGQETIARALAQGHMNRFLTGLEIKGEAIPKNHSPIKSGDRQLGTITSAVFSPTFKKVIAMGYVHREFAKPGSGVSVMMGDTSVDAAVADLPFYKRSQP